MRFYTSVLIAFITFTVNISCLPVRQNIEQVGESVLIPSPNYKQKKPVVALRLQDTVLSDVSQDINNERLADSNEQETKSEEQQHFSPQGTILLRSEKKSGSYMNSEVCRSGSFFVPRIHVSSANASSTCNHYNGFLIPVSNENFNEVTQLLYNCQGAQSRGWIKSWDDTNYGSNCLTLYAGDSISGDGGVDINCMGDLISPVCVEDINLSIDLPSAIHINRIQPVLEKKVMVPPTVASAVLSQVIPSIVMSMRVASIEIQDVPVVHGKKKYHKLKRYYKRGLKK